MLRAFCATYLDVVALVVVAGLAEEPVVHHTVNVELIQQWVTILRELAQVYIFISESIP
jgi:hypothetical protein